MTTVYVDARSLAVGGGHPGGALRPHPRAAAAVQHLVDAGHRVVLLGEGPALQAARPALAGGAAERDGLDTPVLPVDAAGWLVTDDAATCGEARSRRGLRTILVGPSVPDRGLSHRPSDVEARDLIAAVLAILAAEAMPEGR